MKYYLLAGGAYWFIRAMAHEWDNPGFDLAFDIRLMCSSLLLGMAALVTVAEEILKKWRDSPAR